MPDDDRNNNRASGNQGQTWRQVAQLDQFQRPQPLFDRPMEITVGMLRGLRMVDETVVVYGVPTTTKGE